VRCVIAAPEFHERTLADARAERIECLRCDAKGRRLRPAWRRKRAVRWMWTQATLRRWTLRQSCT
jgi:hypothetical protein